MEEEVVCVLHRPDSEVGRVNAVGDDVLFRLRLAYHEDDAILDKLGPGAMVCRTCCSRAMRILEKRFGKASWKAQVQKRRQEQADLARAAVVEAANHPSKRVREEEAGLRFVPSACDDDLFRVGPNERLEDLFRWPALYEMNARFAQLGYPPMVAGPNLLLEESVWRGLSVLIPGCSGRAAELVRRDGRAAPGEVQELLRDVPGSGARVVAAMANLIARPDNVALTRLFVDLLCRVSPPGGARLPLFFGKPLAESQMERILAAVAMSPFLDYAPNVPTAVLWTADFDPPTFVSLAGLAQLPASCLALREALAGKIRIPARQLRLADPASGASVELHELVAVPLLHFVLSPD